MLDLVNPVGAGRGLVGGRREAGLDEFGIGGKLLTHTLDQHAANLGRRSQESNRMHHPDSGESAGRARAPKADGHSDSCRQYNQKT